MSTDSRPFYSAITQGVSVSVTPQFLEDQSDPEADSFVWAYTIVVANESDRQVQLMSRHWIITDGRGHVEHVRGPGVVGEQPILDPGDAFEYTSGCPLRTPSGFMRGTYQMVDEAGAAFDVTVPAFSLDSPYQERRIN
jgi:ApaG protein